MNTGILITFEGIDGSGKSSAAQSLYTALKDEFPVLLTREPGGTELGNQLRGILQQRTYDLDPKAEYLLFAADRAQHMQQVVLPALKKGMIVLSDRMADSSLAYQGYGRGVDPFMITKINEWTMQQRLPDLTIYLEIDYEQATKRLAARQEQVTVFEQEHAEFFERIQQGFEVAFRERNVIRIDGSQDEQTVAQQTYRTVYHYITGTTNESSSRQFMDRS